VFSLGHTVSKEAPLGTLGWVLGAACGGWAGMKRTPDTSVRGVSIDTRTLLPGELFVALKGARYDGHDFVEEAAEKGAAAVLVARELRRPLPIPVMLVEDTLLALQSLAGAHRDRMSVWTVGVTGTNGKTTTKELTALVLGGRLAVLKTEGNYNNQIGLPLTLLRLRRVHETAVLEMGMSGLGEIGLLCRLAKPSVGILTNVGPAHTLQLGSVENIARAKAELAQALGTDGTLVANGDDPWVKRIAGQASCRTLTYGLSGDADMVADSVETEPDGGTAFRVQNVTVRLPLWGQHNVYNALAALLVGQIAGVELGEAAAALEGARPVRGRMQVRLVRGVRVLDDSYNANPASVEAALHALRMVPDPGKKILILGEMLELGSYADRGHRTIGRRAAEVVDIIVGLGSGVRPTLEEASASGVEVHLARDHSEAAALLRQILKPGDAALFKGSRAVEVERVLAQWEGAAGA
jgi:UDP-N-acetylmuramoyl-tripeptide--D-alanyl-D-alanine ligase